MIAWPMLADALNASAGVPLDAVLVIPRERAQDVRSVVQALNAVEAAGATVAAVICIVDRLQGARELLAPKYNYRPIFTIRDFGIEASKE